MMMLLALEALGTLETTSRMISRYAESRTSR
jgi:hypothetical protein